MLSPCPACQDTKIVHELREDADGHPYRSATTYPCLLCTTPTTFVRRTATPRITATYQYLVAGKRVPGHEGEEYCDCARELRALVRAELMFADTVFHGAHRWRDPVVGGRVDLRFTRHRDGQAITYEAAHVPPAQLLLWHCALNWHGSPFARPWQEPPGGSITLHVPEQHSPALKQNPVPLQQVQAMGLRTCGGAQVVTQVPPHASVPLGQTQRPS